MARHKKILSRMDKMERIVSVDRTAMGSEKNAGVETTTMMSPSTRLRLF